jgi:hypothetical protein
VLSTDVPRIARSLRARRSGQCRGRSETACKARSEALETLADPLLAGVWTDGARAAWQRALCQANARSPRRTCSRPPPFQGEHERERPWFYWFPVAVQEQPRTHRSSERLTDEVLRGFAVISEESVSRDSVVWHERVAFNHADAWRLDVVVNALFPFDCPRGVARVIDDELIYPEPS